jgi:ankyrin repeat protein
MAPIMLKLLRSLREYHFGRDELLSFRMFTALMPLLMSGLPSERIPTALRSVAEFLNQNRFSEPDDETDASGFTPLVFAAISGNIGVVRELITTHHVDVDARVRVGIPKFGVEKGMGTLALVASSCPQDKVREMASFLLASGADPNLPANSGVTSLIAAVTWQNLEGVRALVSCADVLDLEKGITANNATALLIAGAYGTFEILEALLQAGANREHK